MNELQNISTIIAYRYARIAIDNFRIGKYRLITIIILPVPYIILYQTPAYIENILKF